MGRNTLRHLGSAASLEEYQFVEAGSCLAVTATSLQALGHVTSGADPEGLVSLWQS